MKIKAINGVKDILSDEIVYWQKIEKTARDIFRRFGINEIRLPILEKTELFARSIGEATDIVEKEMYTFVDKGITMRPEITASLLRAYVEHGLQVRQPIQRLFSIGPVFRHERPQKGRQRQFHQVDVEVIGAQEPQVDAELMAMGQMLLNELNLDVSLEINSLGCPECRPDFRKKLIAYLHERHDSLCDDCKRRIEKNPLRVLDCKQQGCRAMVQEAPSIVDNLCSACEEHFAAVRKQLDRLEVSYTLNRFMVRGLDYYNRTTFEFLTTDLGAQAAVAAGGRYDGLVEQLGGPKNTPGIGFAMGMERLCLLMQQQEGQQEEQGGADIFIAALGEQAIAFAAPFVHQLRKLGLQAAMDYSNRSLKAQMKQAGRLKAGFTLIIGEQELEQGRGILRNMDTQEQNEFSLQEGAAMLAEVIAPDKA
ncbi:histidyl-tRNA synthetase [Candidatus Electrothrix aarhusensis]|uniref:Histidine--tRNA ligase n=1 Tax=Candidatus Electrothrix aarhusensis TaxID=1859131 RepID=A0A3S3UCG4_9BACT|nr:histidyl-tRNA synthetase [Candidatus Electrothrix aarhusensis]